MSEPANAPSDPFRDSLSDDVIAAEAYRIWEAEGRPIWSNAYDHWLRAIEALRARQGETVEAPTPAAGSPAKKATSTKTKTV